MNSPFTSSPGRPSFGGRRGDQALCQRGRACSLRAVSLRTGSLPLAAGAPERRRHGPQNKRRHSATFGRATNRWPGGARPTGPNPRRAAPEADLGYLSSARQHTSMHWPTRTATGAKQILKLTTAARSGHLSRLRSLNVTLNARITLRSTGPATAGQLGPVGGTRYIFAKASRKNNMTKFSFAAAAPCSSNRHESYRA